MSADDRMIDPGRDAAFVDRLTAGGGHARLIEPRERAALERARAFGGVAAAATRAVARPSEPPSPGPAPIARAKAPPPAPAPAPAAPEPRPVAAKPAAEPKLRPIKALADARDVTRNPIAPPPKIAWIPVDRLMIDEGYQRAIGKRGRQNILRLVSGWDWNCYKPLSVAPIADREGYYEVVDGQHSAIAAATHGSVELLPCVVLSAGSRAEKAKAFLGINRDRVTLTAFALFRARMAAGDPVAGAVGEALDGAGVFLVESLQAGSAAERAGVRTAAVGALSAVARRRGGGGPAAGAGHRRRRRGRGHHRRADPRPGGRSRARGCAAGRDAEPGHRADRRRTAGRRGDAARAFGRPRRAHRHRRLGRGAARGGGEGR